MIAATKVSGVEVMDSVVPKESAPWRLGLYEHVAITNGARRSMERQQIRGGG